MRASARRLQAAANASRADGAAIREKMALPVGALVAAALAALVVGAMLHAGLVGGRSAVAAPSARPYAFSHESLLSLPLAAQGPVSEALGAGQPAYRVERYQAALRSANPAQHLSTNFTSSGVSVSASATHVGLRLRAFGYGSTLASVRAAAPRAYGSRVVYSHPGVSEWYANGPLGVQQGFTIAHAPAGQAAGPLTLSMALSGNARASLARDGQSITLARNGKSVLSYGGLSVTDARGHSLHGWLALTGGRLLLRIDAARARYPVRIDPLIQTAELTAADGAAENFLGISVAVSGNTIVAGAPGREVASHSNQGEVYVFEELGAGWTQTAELTASDGALDTGIGSSVAVSGSTIVAGASGREEERGAVYVFERSGSGWPQVAELRASEETIGNRLGFSVALSGGTVVAGAPGHKVNKEPAKGAVYVFEKPGSGWADGTQTAELTASPGGEDAELGAAVAASGNTVVAGAAHYMYGRGLSDGAVFVFEGSGSSWTQAAELTASNGELGDALGFSVAMSGDTVVAGAPERKVGSNPALGAVYVFEKPASGWASGTQTAELTASDGDERHSFGYSVALSENTIVVGSPASLGAGELYLFGKPPSGWGNAAQPLTYPSSGGDGPDIGWSVALSGHTIVAGELVRDVDSHSKQGAVFVFTGEPSVPPVVTSTPSATTTPTTITPTPPVLTDLAQSNRSWREGKLLASFSRRHKLLPLGTTFSFSLNVPASVTFTFTQSASGRKVGKTCVAQTKKNKSKHRCTRSVLAGTLTFAAHAGENKVRFEGLISKHNKLAPGSYTLLVTATASGEHSTPRTLNFTITGS